MKKVYHAETLHLLSVYVTSYLNSCVGYKVRNLLAAIDCNKHLNRPQQAGPDGKPKYVNNLT